MSTSPPYRSNRPQQLATLIAVILFVLLLFFPESRHRTEGELPAAAQRLAAVTLLMGVLWITQVVPIAATSLVPLVAYPLLGIQSARDVSNAYIDSNVFLFLGGFIVALGIEKWGLHKRMALHIVRVLGTSPRRVVLGFMLATAFLSMWISNTAATLLMMPIALAMLTSLGDLPAAEAEAAERSSLQNPSSRGLVELAAALMISIAYASSVGGFTTLVGTPTNVQFLAVWHNAFPSTPENPVPEVSAGQWMAAAAPLGVCFLLLVWGVLTWRLPSVIGERPLERSFFTERLKALGPPRRAEWMMLAVFSTTALLWITRAPLQFGSEPWFDGWGLWLERMFAGSAAVAHWGVKSSFIHDSTVAMGMALLMFCLPAARDEYGVSQPLMDWQTARRLPWSILLLIGGGFAIAGAFQETGLAEWLGAEFATQLQDQPVWLLIAGTCLVMTFLTEFTSNVATVAAVLPVLAGAAVQMEIDPRLIMFPATISTSCAFMLPIATPPNAIIFGSGRVAMGRMVRVGVILNLLGVMLVTVATYAFIVPQFGIQVDGAPEWSKRAAAAAAASPDP